MPPVIAFGLAFGDEGKGTTVEYIASKATPHSLVVRYNGGHQAGHNIVRPDGTWHCFAQVGSGSFEGCETHLSRYMHIEPDALLCEIGVLNEKGVNPERHMTIDPRAVIVTPAHKMVNQMREVANGHATSTCGCGVGDAAKDFRDGIFISLAHWGSTLKDRLEYINAMKRIEADRIYKANPSPELEEMREYFEARMHVPDLLDTYHELLGAVRRVADEERLDTDTPIIFEGSQGTLLDYEHGFAPYITKSRATHHNAKLLRGDALKLGILPAFSHRHGNGPLPTEDRRLLEYLADPHNPENEWQGPFRVGWFDVLLARYAIGVNGGVDRLALTKVDMVERLPELKICTSYRYRGDLTLLEGKVEAVATDWREARITALTGSGEDLTPILENCEPLDWETPSSLSEYVRTIESLVSCKVSLLSAGPTVMDKVDFTE